MRAIILTLVLSLALHGSVSAGGDSVSAATLIIDVRTEMEWNTGHIEGAILIPFDKIAQDITKVTTDVKARVYLYCRSGRRSSLALDDLKKAGYTNVINLGTVDDASKKLNRHIVK